MVNVNTILRAGSSKYGFPGMKVIFSFSILLPISMFSSNRSARAYSSFLKVLRYHQQYISAYSAHPLLVNLVTLLHKEAIFLAALRVSEMLAFAFMNGKTRKDVAVQTDRIMYRLLLKEIQ